MTSTETHAPLIPGAHRVVRVLDPDEGPYAGSLVTNGGSVAVRVDVRAISGWDAWAHAGDEHVAGPVDIVRHSDGHGVLLPWCTERLAAFVGRRQADGLEFSSGEVSTLVGSLLRGLDELAASREGDGAARGDWWLTEDGRPLFVIGTGEDARESAARIVERLCEHCPDRSLGRLLGAVRDGLRALGARPGAPRRQLVLWEAELFATAAPRPLEREARTPARVRDIELVRTLRAAPAVLPGSRRPRSGGGGDPSARTTFARLLPTVAAGAAAARARLSAVRAAAVGRVARGRGASGPRRAFTLQIRRSDGAPRHGGEARAASRRPRLLLVGGAMAAAVLAAGLLWPGDATGRPASSTGAPGVHEQTTEPTDDAAAAAPAGVESQPPMAHRSTPTPSTDSAEPDDPLSAAKTLLASIRDCATVGDESCAGAVAEGSSGVVALLGAGAAAAPAPELVDRYGDVAVIRASVRAPEPSEGAADRMIVLVWLAEKWLVRDAYDVADQPG